MSTQTPITSALRPERFPGSLGNTPAPEESIAELLNDAAVNSALQLADFPPPD
jgi:hypothetical protein